MSEIALFFVIMSVFAGIISVAISYVVFTADVQYKNVKNKRSFILGLIPLGYLLAKAINYFEELPK